MIPEIITKLINEQYSNEQVKQILKAYDQPKRVCFRVNNLKAFDRDVLDELDSKLIKYERFPIYTNAYVIDACEEKGLTSLECYANGGIYLQNISSMIPPLAFNLETNKTFIDLAAAPGGKTCEMAALTNNKISITACEKNKIRFERLKYNLNKQGVKNVALMNSDASNLDEYFSFDYVLLDAPCSGSGTISLYNQGSYQLTEEYLNKTIQKQIKLLNKAIQLVKVNQEIIYSTCSILKNENEEVIRKILKNKNIKVVPITNINQSYLPLLPSTIEGALTIMPTDIFEGFFICKLTKIAK